MAKTIPTLSSTGWARGALNTIDRALSYALLTDGLQSNIYRGNLTSIPVLFAETQGKKNELQLQSGRLLENYFQRLFTSASVNTEVREVQGRPGHLNLVISAVVEIDGEQIDIQRVALFYDGKFREIMNLVNA